MENNIIFLKDPNLKITRTIEDNVNDNIYIIDTFNKNVDLNIDVVMKSNSNLNIIISSLNKNNYKKNYKVFVDHIGNNSNSYCEVYGIANNNSQSHFNLEARVNKDTNGNYCDQKIRGILISKNAHIEGDPNLIIDTNNLKAKHALAVGQLNKNHLFYLQSKGISKKDAVKLLLLSYFNVILHKIEDETEREKIVDNIFNEIGDLEI